ncbi:hypothetical protein KGF56_004415 [Candida oxycetoniae]|uniref:Oxidoreductase-like domain-containing protein n=1 Tax=Candida oxycetoniae TaxID=497107 RepID=A0AAI9STU3_9ASCO|nr:uncharacterized protein KGF56_004415 [Candida oxycetoniae]KAI3402741.1 hypothetical protein KGF56_004415 [Candida oxycetoniae]
MISRSTRRLATAYKLRPTNTTSKREAKRYAFYDLVLRTPSHPTHPIEASLMTTDQLQDLKRHTKTRYEGNYTIDRSLTNEERIRKVFGGRIKGEARQSTSRINRREPQVVAGITVPARPPEPDNCCMSGCINCVWEIFDEDLKEWNDKRGEAAKRLNEMGDKGGRWPENFDAPLKLLQRSHFPESLKDKSNEELFGGKTQEGNAKSDEDEQWGSVPVSIRVFAAVEKKLKMKHKQNQQTQA